PVIAGDETVYIQTGDGSSEPARHSFSNTLLALSPRELALKHSVMLTAEGSRPNKSVRDLDLNVPSPVVFTYKTRDMVVTAGHDGRLYLLDGTSSALLYRTPLIAVPENSADRGVWGSISSWEDADGTRWVLASVWGPAHSDLKPLISNGSAPNGS